MYQITAASRTPRSLCPLSSTEFVEPPPPKKIPGYATVVTCFMLQGSWKSRSTNWTMRQRRRPSVSTIHVSMSVSTRTVSEIRLRTRRLRLKVTSSYVLFHFTLLIVKGRSFSFGQILSDLNVTTACYCQGAGYVGMYTKCALIHVLSITVYSRI